ncbi:MAG: hypothetical protein K5669_09935 [Lachnospiraceae bacterium]|nr:hypothetical protein [Lachnospiraceae bacterium]
METNNLNRIKSYIKILDKYRNYISTISNTIDVNEDISLYFLSFVPVLISFASYVIEDAKRRGIDRLYFLSRDGYQMYLIAKKIIEIKSLKIECRYLKVSRYSMRVPGYHFDIDKAIESMCTSGIDVTLLKILKRGALSEDECNEVLRELSIDWDINRVLTYPEVCDLKEILKNSEKLREYIYNHSKKAYDSAFGYLKQEGLLNENYALVDSGWVGTLQLSIEEMVRSKGDDIKVEGYYFGMYDYPNQIKHNRLLKSRFHTFYFSPVKGIKRKSRFSNSLFESVVTSMEGMTVGYKEVCERFIPVEDVSNNSDKTIIGRCIDALKIFLDSLGEIPQFDKGDIEKILYLLMSSPSEFELKVFGNIPFSDDLVEKDKHYVAENMSREMIRNQRVIRRFLIIKGFIKAQLKESAWIEGSAVRAYLEDISNPESSKRNIERELRHIRLCKGITHLRKQIKNL